MFITEERLEKIKSVSWVTYFIKLTKEYAMRSTCVRRKVGCLAVNDDNRLLSAGFNGNIPKHPHCTKDNCLRILNNIKPGEHPEICRAIHAEINCIVGAAITGVNLSGCTFYITTMPCPNCFKALLSVKPKLIIFQDNYNLDSIKYILDEEKNTTIIQLDMTEEECTKNLYISKAILY